MIREARRAAQPPQGVLRLRVENRLGSQMVKGIELIECVGHLKSINKGVAVVVRGLNSILAARTVAMARKVGRCSHKSFLRKVLSEMIGHQCFGVTKGWLGPPTHWFRPRHVL